MGNFSSLIQSLVFLAVIIVLVKGLPLLLRIFKSKENPRSEIIEEEDEAFPYVKKNVMSPTELKLYGRLVSAFPNYLVFTQVQLSQAVKAPSGMDQFKWNNRINRMSLDFVICEKSSNPICVIELDDKTHLRDSVKIRDEKKDKALNTAEIPIVRIKVAEMPTVAQLPKLLGIVV
jgi:hypothetical protein